MQLHPRNRRRYGLVAVGWLVAVCTAGGVLADDPPTRLWTNQDLLRLFGPAAEPPPPTPEERMRAEADAQAWAFVQDFIGRQQSQLDEQRDYELDRKREAAEAELIDRTKTAPDGGYPYPVLPVYPFPRVPRPEPPPHEVPEPPDDPGTRSPSPRLDFTFDRMGDRRARIERPFGGKTDAETPPPAHASTPAPVHPQPDR